MSFIETKKSFEEDISLPHSNFFQTVTTSATTPLKTIEKKLDGVQEQLDYMSKRIDDLTTSEILNINDIYPEAIVGEMGTILELLTKSVDLLKEALTTFDVSQVKSDEYVQQFQFLLPDLIYFRNVGDGFGIIISSILIAFENKEGIPLDKNQLMLIRQVIMNLKNEPLLDTMRAIEYCDKMEDCGLKLESISDNLDAVIDEIIS